MRYVNRIILAVMLLAAFLSIEVLAPRDNHAQPVDEDPCSFVSLREPGTENRRFALVVGVSTYATDSGVGNLSGAHVDARHVRELLTEPGGYGFPDKNVCLLRNDEATSDAFLAAVDKITEGLRDDDLIVIYFAGHGSQTRDDGEDVGDEPDRMDETIIFHDGVEMVDDRFNEIIADLREKTDRITVILDSCNSGTAFRGLNPGTARWQEPDDSRPKLRAEKRIFDRSEGFVSEVLRDVVFLVAADDGTPALERGARGVFTRALLETLTQNGHRTLTYDQLKPMVVKRVARRSAQRPSFHGATNRFVFDNEERTRVSALTVTSVIPLADGAQLELTGPLIFGVESGAILTLYDGNIGSEKLGDPEFAKARAVVESRNGFQTTARLIETVADATDETKVGDFAMLVQPVASTETTAFFVHDEVDTELKAEIAASLEDYPGLTPSADAESADFRIFQKEQRFYLAGPSGFVRNSFCLGVAPTCQFQSKEDLADEMVERLHAHAFHNAFANMLGEGGDLLTDDESVLISVTKSQRKSQEAECAGRQIGAAGDGIVTVPICPGSQPGGYQKFYYDVSVTLDPELPSDTKLFVGGVVFWNNGSRQALTRDANVPVKPGDGPVLLEPVLQSGPPLHALDHIMVFATSEEINWKDMTYYTRSADWETQSPVAKMLESVRKGTRGGSGVAEEEPYGIWTHSSAYTRVEPNRKFVEPSGEDVTDTREYTIAGFDIRPYLPDDPDSSLRLVLTRAHELTISGGTDGHRYAQHSWLEDTDEKNLEIGIDCSRSIWFAFTRGGLDYTSPGSMSSKQYLPTVSMVSTSSPLSNNFERCDDQSLQLGDVLVYRDDTQGDGHTVMVIDPVTRVAWGSHNWDGNGNTPGFVKDKGVEYQLIKIKQDWERWDRRTMFQKACWRHRSFTDESRANTGLAIEKCDAGLNCSI